jgi:hypothetical protein
MPAVRFVLLQIQLAQLIGRQKGHVALWHYISTDGLPNISSIKYR